MMGGQARYLFQRGKYARKYYCWDSRTGSNGQINKKKAKKGGNFFSVRLGCNSKKKNIAPNPKIKKPLSKQGVW